MCDHLKTPMNHSVELGKAIYIAFEFAGKYPLHGYILGVLTHTTAWTGQCMKVRFAHFSSGLYVPALSYVAL